MAAHEGSCTVNLYVPPSIRSSGSRSDTGVSRNGPLGEPRIIHLLENCQTLCPLPYPDGRDCPSRRSASQRISLAASPVCKPSRRVTHLTDPRLVAWS